MKKVFLVILFLFCAEFAFSQVWTTIDLGENVSIDFISAPEEIIVKTRNIYELAHDDYYMFVEVTDLDAYSSFKIKEDDLHEYAEEHINISLDWTADPKEISRRPVTIGEVTGWEIIFTKHYNGIDNIMVTKRLFIYDKKMFIIEFWERSGKEFPEIKDRFINSFLIEI